MSLDGVLERVRALRADCASYGALVRGDALCDSIITAIERAIDRGNDQWLTLDEAAALSGFSTRQLRRLAQQGRVESRRQDHTLFVNAHSLPRKPKAPLSSNAEVPGPAAKPTPRGATVSHPGVAL